MSKFFENSLNEDTKELVTQEKIDEALEELKEKTDQQVEQDTAIKWAARYLAAKQIDGRDADRYRHEALEHAALAGKEFFNRLVDEIGEETT